MSCGIYKIESSLFPNRFYYGSASDIKKRWNRHLFDLRRNKHHSIKLQRHCNKYGISDLVFSIVQECERTELLTIEQYYLDNYSSYFNNSPTAKSNLGSKLSEETRLKMSKWRIGIKRSDEIKAKISKSLTGRKLSNETREKMRIFNTGKIYTSETREKMRLARLGKKYKLISK